MEILSITKIPVVLTGDPYSRRREFFSKRAKIFDAEAEEGEITSPNNDQDPNWVFRILNQSGQFASEIRERIRSFKNYRTPNLQPIAVTRSPREVITISDYSILSQEAAGRARWIRRGSLGTHSWQRLPESAV